MSSEVNATNASRRTRGTLLGSTRGGDFPIRLPVGASSCESGDLDFSLRAIRAHSFFLYFSPFFFLRFFSFFCIRFLLAFLYIFLQKRSSVDARVSVGHDTDRPTKVLEFVKVNLATLKVATNCEHHPQAAAEPSPVRPTSRSAPPGVLGVT